MCINGKMRPVKIIPGIGGRKIKEKDGKDKLNYELLQEIL
jgi:hypothetical protein